MYRLCVNMHIRNMYCVHILNSTVLFIPSLSVCVVYRVMKLLEIFCGRVQILVRHLLKWVLPKRSNLEKVGEWSQSTRTWPPNDIYFMTKLK